MSTIEEFYEKINDFIKNHKDEFIKMLSEEERLFNEKDAERVKNMNDVEFKNEIVKKLDDINNKLNTLFIELNMIKASLGNILPQRPYITYCDSTIFGIDK